MGAVIAGVSPSLRVFRAAFRSPDLRRVELAFVGFSLTEWGTWIAIMVYAYRAGGAAGAGAVGVIQLVPAALFAPFASILGDRYRRDRVLLGGYLCQAVTVFFTGLAMVRAAPVPLVYTLAAAVCIAITLTRPVQGALLPSLTNTPQELTAANVAAGWIESLSVFGGPLLAGILLAASSPGVVFLVMTVVVLCSALLATGVAPHWAAAEPGAVEDGVGPVWQLLGGIQALATDHRPRVVISILSADFVVVGALDVLLVILAFHVLHIGSSGVGFLNSAYGIGGLLGASATTLLIARRRLAPALVAGTLCWGVGLAPLGLTSSPVVALSLVVVAGIGRPLIDVSGRTLLQRVVADHLLARVFGVLEGLSMGTQAIGYALGPVLYLILGDRAAFPMLGLLLPALVALLWRSLNRIDAASIVPQAEISLLRSLSIFAPLPAPVIERLARRLVPLKEPAGTVLIRQGDPGDWFYIIQEGQVSVDRDGAPVASLGPGEFFGEIALLRDVPRTATVTAGTSVQLYALERADFLEAVTGHAQSAEAAHAVAESRLQEQGAPASRVGYH
jgi:MFS family permease